MNTLLKYLIFLSIFFGISLLTPMRAYADDSSEDAIIILDASGSMWGQIEGKNKITIARTVLGQLLDDLPESRRLGLMAYGHNRKGDCSDIEMLAKVGASRTDMKAKIKAINPKGKTPISASVQQAAERLKYTENKATIILISDGIETCNLDPCALGKQLEKDGIDFTAHVVGFDVVDKETEDQLQCLANSTGGRYLSAASAGELSIALGETVGKKEIGLAPAKLHLEATILVGGLIIEKGLNWKIQQSGGGEIMYQGEDMGAVTQSVPPGVYDIFVTRPSDALSGESRLVDLRPSDNKTITIALNPEFDAHVTPDRKKVTAGTEFSVKWDGPNRKSDFLTITKPDAPARSYTSYAYTSNGNPLKLTAPIVAGEYEVRYVLSRPYKILARTPINVGKGAASVKGPNMAIGGSAVPIEWTGPATQSDFVTITVVDAGPSAYLDYFYTKKSASPKNLTLPVEAGVYEIRYVFVGKVSGGGIEHRVIARQEITISQASATLVGPEKANVGQTISIDWTGPSNSGDFITVTAPDAGERKYLDYAYTKNGTPAKISMPVLAGKYELRFVQNNSKVIARQMINIMDISIKLDAPKTAKAGETITVGFDGNAERGDWITVIRPGARASQYGDYFYTINGSPGKLDMPKQAGNYEIRYVLKGKRVIAKQAIIVTK